MLETLFNTIITEYGGFLALLLFNNVVLGLTIKTLWKCLAEKDSDLKCLSESFIEALNNNTKVLTQVNTNIEHDISKLNGQ